MREAAAAGDAGTLASYIDFPTVRASARAQLRPRLVFRGHGLGWKLAEVRIARAPGRR